MFIKKKKIKKRFTLKTICGTEIKTIFCFFYGKHFLSETYLIVFLLLTNVTEIILYADKLYQ